MDRWKKYRPRGREREGRETETERERESERKGGGGGSFVKPFKGERWGRANSTGSGDKESQVRQNTQ